MIVRLFKKLLRIFNNKFGHIKRSVQSYLISLATERAWLLDFIPSSKEGSDSIMLVRLDVIGDFVLWLDSARAYRNIYPSKRLVLYANSSWAELARHFNYWDEVVSVDMVRLRTDDLYRIKTFYNIRRRGFTVAIQPTYSREYMGDMLTRSSAASVRIGYQSDLSNILLEQKQISDCWYTQLIHSSRSPMMELNRNAAFVRAIGDEAFVSNIPQIPPLLDLPENLKFNSPYVVIFPGASWIPKMWPSSKFSDLIKKVKNNHSVDIILCGANAEYELCQKIINESAVIARNLAGATKLEELVEIIRGACLIVCNDTSAVHIAAATQTSSICLLGGGHYGRFLPYDVEMIAIKKIPTIQNYKMDCYNCNWQCKYIQSELDTVPCIENLSVEQAYIECINKLALT
jgi:ADP-heptose:LPS heptosyltransferase